MSLGAVLQRVVQRRVEQSHYGARLLGQAQCRELPGSVGAGGVGAAFIVLDIGERTVAVLAGAEQPVDRRRLAHDPAHAALFARLHALEKRRVERTVGQHRQPSAAGNCQQGTPALCLCGAPPLNIKLPCLGGGQQAAEQGFV